MIVEETKIEGLKLLIPQVFYDFRGEYIETYNENNLNAIAPHPLRFIQDDISTSSKNVLRGIHGDRTTWKLVQCVHGNIYSVIVDNRPDSKTFLKWQAFSLTEYNRYQLLIPPGCGNSVLALSDQVVYHYKQTTYYDRDSQFTLAWDDPKLGIFWPVKDVILSERDSKAAYL